MRYPRAVPLAIFVLIAAVTLLSVFAIERVEHEKARAELGENAQTVASAIESRASASAAYLLAGGALFSTLESVSESQFRRFVTELQFDRDYGGAEGIGWARAIEANQIDAFQQETGSENNIDAAIRSARGAGRRMAVPVTFLEPELRRNRVEIGYDMFSDPGRRAAMLEAAQSGRPRSTGRVALAMDGEKTAPGFLIYMPVFENAGTTRRLKGFIYSPFTAQRFLESALSLEPVSNVGIRLYEGGTGESAQMAQIGLDEPSGRAVTDRIMIAGQPWIIEVEARKGPFLSSLSLATLLFGLLVASLLMILVRLLTQQSKEDQEALDWLEEQNSIRNSLTRELNHRVKNTLANVLSIIALTKRRSPDIDSFAEGLGGRIRALSATHDLLTLSDWSSTPIQAVLEAELAPYADTHEQMLNLSGPHVELAPNDALSMGLVIHELATNAAKYGALSCPGGNVQVTWHRLSDELAQLEWKETGGPSVPEERPRGFGTDLIEKVVAHELGNPVDLAFESDGVRCTLSVPVRRASRFAIRARQFAGKA